MNDAGTLVLAFGDSSLLDDDRPLRELKARFPSAVVLGCSTAGGVLGARVVDDALFAAVAHFERTTLRTVAVELAGTRDCRAAGREIGRQLAGPDLRAIFILSDGLIVNGSELVAGLNDTVPAGVTITGGLAADSDRFRRTWVLQEGRPVQGMVTAVGFDGSDLRVGHGSLGGWDIFGPERRVTRSRANVLYEIDGKPALDLYRSYLGELATGLPSTGLLFPLSVRDDEGSVDAVTRTVLAVDETERSMTFAGNVAEGSLVRLMKANLDRLIDGASGAARRACTGVPGPVERHTLAIAISCVGRRLVLGERTDEELEAVLEHLPGGTQQVGFYSYGEISPSSNGRCDLHNQTMTLTTFCER